MIKFKIIMINFNLLIFLISISEIPDLFIYLYMNTILLDLLAFGSVLSGILVITSKNPIISVLFLIAVFVNVACYLILLGINFIGLTYLILYVGAIAILFLFVVMMMNIKLVEISASSNRFSDSSLANQNRGAGYSKNLPLGAIVGTIFLNELLSVLPSSITTNDNKRYIDLFDNINFFSLGTVEGKEIKGGVFNFNFNGLWDTIFNPMDQLQSIGSSLYMAHVLFLIIGSVILLLAMVGPIILTHKPTKRLH